MLRVAAAAKAGVQLTRAPQAFTAMGGFLIEVEKDTDAENQQKSYYEIQRSLSSGAVSSLRSCCFKLYRSHVTDPKQFKEAEAQYKVVIKALEKFSVYALKASRNEIKGDELKSDWPRPATSPSAILVSSFWDICLFHSSRRGPFLK